MLITNCVLLNTGDAAILDAILDRLRAALGDDTEFDIADSQPEVARRHYPELSIRPLINASFRPVPTTRGLGRVAWWWRRRCVRVAAWCIAHRLGGVTRLWIGPDARAALEARRRADVVISTGGTYLVERYPLRERILELEAVLALGRPLVLFTQSLGPFGTRHRRAVRAVAGRARLVLLRDERSRCHLAELGVAGDHVRVVADAVFGLRTPVRPPPHDGLHVAVSVRDWPYAAGDAARANLAYREAIAALVGRLVHARDARVTFMSTCQGVPEYWADDAAVALEVHAMLPPDVREQVRVDAEFHAPNELLTLLAGYDLVVATRMHMAILSLVAGTPAFPIAYEFKTRELATRLGLGEWVRDFEDVDAAWLPDAVERFLARPPDVLAAVVAAVERERDSAFATAGLLRRALAAPSREAPAHGILA